MTGIVRRIRHITRAMVRAEPQTIWVFGDNMAGAGFAGQAREMRGEPNALGVPTKWSPRRDHAAYFCDDDADNPDVRIAIIAAFQHMRSALKGGRDVVIPADGLGTGLAELPTRAPRIHRAIEARIAALTGAAYKQTGLGGAC